MTVKQKTPAAFDDDEIKVALMLTHWSQQASAELTDSEYTGKQTAAV